MEARKGQPATWRLPSLHEFVKLKHELNQIIAKHSQQDYQKVHDVSDRDYWMTAREAKGFGIIDEVLAGKGAVAES